MDFTDIIVNTCGICYLEFCFKIVLNYPIEIKITDSIFKQDSMIQFKIEAFPVITLFQETYLQLSQTICNITNVFTYILCIHNIYYNFTLYIYALNNLYISFLIFWAVFQHNLQQQLLVCKEFYTRRQHII